MIALLAVAALISVAVLRRSDPPSTRLPRVTGADYQVSVTMYYDGEGLVCQPFKLEIAYDSQPDFQRNVLVADQADDVTVAQTASTVYVFYNNLSLANFGAFTFDDRDAKPLLCNTGIPLCAAEKKRLSDAGTEMHMICGRVRR